MSEESWANFGRAVVFISGFVVLGWVIACAVDAWSRYRSPSYRVKRLEADVCALWGRISAVEERLLRDKRRQK